MNEKLPDFRGYISPYVKEGVRYLSGDEAEAAWARLKRALRRLKNRPEADDE